MSKKSKRPEILQAAARVIQNKGVLNLTLEAVAEEANVSKGGLLYHFPSKEALIEGMVHYLMDTYVERIRTDAENDPMEKGKWTRAFIRETFKQSYTNREMNASLLAAVAVNPDLLEPIKNAYREWQQHIEKDGLDAVDATILRLATDGLWLSGLFGLAPLDDDSRREILNTLIERTKEI